MNEDKEKSLRNYIAMTTILFAVCATLASFRASKFSTQSLMNQTQAQNQWAYFQSKSIKSYMYELNKDGLELDKNMFSKILSQDALQKIDDKILKYKVNIIRYDKEKNEIQNSAKEYESMRDKAKKYSTLFGISVIFLQIGILLCSIAALIHEKMLWFLGMIIGFVGIVYFIVGFLPSI